MEKFQKLHGKQALPAAAIPSDAVATALSRIAPLLLAFALVFALSACASRRVDSETTKEVDRISKDLKNKNREFLLGIAAAFANDHYFVSYDPDVSDDTIMHIRYYAHGVRDSGEKSTVKSYRNSKILFTRAANKNHAAAQFHLSLLYEFGRGIYPDQNESLLWLRKSAKANYAPAQKRLAEREKFLADAAETAKREAEIKQPAEQYELARRFREGDGVLKNRVEAVKWCRKAAEGGFAAAQFEFGMRLLTGDGVPKNETEALVWFEKARQQHNALAECAIAQAHSKGLGVPKNEAKAFSTYNRLAAAGLSTAQYNLAILYKEGRGVEKNESQSLAWARKAAAQGFVPAYALIKSFYAKDNIVDNAKQYDDATLVRLRVAAEHGNPDAQFLLGHAIMKKFDGQSADREAVQFITSAATQGNYGAQAELGHLLASDTQRGGLVRNRHEGFRWYCRAAVSNKTAKELPSAFLAGLLSSGADAIHATPYLKIQSEVRAETPVFAPVETLLLPLQGTDC
ncbi:MAG: sel1 repeat family protein [Puniceicoccales bacterium]|jgi:TPR repeat protein|nr:sel1 repeat family protein [Puniceicoccales bacterium]